MTADTLKTTRVLELYQDFLSGKLINKQQAAEQYHVNVRSIQRDIDSIRDFLSEQCAKEGIVRKIEYDKKENGYRLVTQEIEQLSKGEVLALCKILLESRAFTKEQVEKIAQTKMPDLTAADLDAAMSMIAGTARSMGIEVVD